jgi:hypothetical protein
MTMAAVAVMRSPCAGCVQANVVTDTVFVGNPGYAGESPDTGAGGHGPDRIFRAVEYNYTIGSPYYRTGVGAHEDSNRSYGMFGQDGNVREWNGSDAVSLVRL